jgi:hypothetical protein
MSFHISQTRYWECKAIDKGRMICPITNIKFPAMEPIYKKVCDNIGCETGSAFQPEKQYENRRHESPNVYLFFPDLEQRKQASVNVA